MIIVDTNVLEETMRPAPNPDVLAWLNGLLASSVFTTAITQAEIAFGIALLPAGRRRERLEHAATAIFEVDLGGRVLPFDSNAARAFAPIAATRRSQGRPISQYDAQIAAIASTRRAALATRNVRDFEGLGLSLINPWQI